MKNIQIETNKEKFTYTLTKMYEELFLQPSYGLVASRYTPRALAEKIVDSLIQKTANKDGTGIIRTCKCLGINCTYKAILEYITA